MMICIVWVHNEILRCIVHVKIMVQVALGWLYSAFIREMFPDDNGKSALKQKPSDKLDRQWTEVVLSITSLDQIASNVNPCCVAAEN